MIIRPGILLGNISDVGCEREKNEDYFGYFEPEEEALYRIKGRLAIVADGMGGMAGGYAASRTAVDVIHEEYTSHISANPKEALNDAIVAANDVIFGQAEEDPSLKGMGTTVTAMVIKGDLAFFAQVGDSRAYLIRSGKISQRTRDQTKVARLVEEGIISPADAEDHPDAHILSQAVGNKVAVNVDTDMPPVEVEPGDRFLLCSDGLHGLVSDQEMAQIATSEDPNGACHTLVELAKQRGGHDNITVQIVQIPGAGRTTGPPLPSPDTVTDIPDSPPQQVLPAKRNLLPFIIIGAVLLLGGAAAAYYFATRPPDDEKKDDETIVRKDGAPEKSPDGAVKTGEHGPCGPGLQLCGKGTRRGCTNIRSNYWHCGECDKKCPRGWRCKGGRCAKPVRAINKKKCKGSKKSCDGKCVNLQTSAKHCGVCKNKCKACKAGKCTKPKCPNKKHLRCFGKCIDPRNDPLNCGKCKRNCGSDLCNNGTCAARGGRPAGACKRNEKKCGDECVDIKKNARHCGRCNFGCMGAARCVKGKCETGRGPGPATPAKVKCQAPLKRCGKQCVDIMANQKHCGRCKNACTGGKPCVLGKCKFIPCPRGQTRCGRHCTFLKTDRNNCGKCGKICLHDERCEDSKCWVN